MEVTKRKGAREKWKYISKDSDIIRPIEICCRAHSLGAVYTMTYKNALCRNRCTDGRLISYVQQVPNKKRQDEIREKTTCVLFT